jgi:cytochrome b
MEPVNRTAHLVRVWDLPTRVFHWALLACVVGLFVTGKLHGNWMVWHFRLGYCVAGLLIFRLVWGLVGGHWSRFGSFLYGPRRVWAYLRGQNPPQDSVGHNPLGALSVFALLAVLLVQVGTGLISDDEIAFQGPFNRYVAQATGYAANAWHKGYGEWLIWGLVGLHVAAIAFYSWVRREKLIRPMVHGDKTLDFEAPQSRDDRRMRLRALAIVVVIGVALAGLIAWAGRP